MAKYKVLERCFYNNRLYEPGDTVQHSGDNVPPWLELAESGAEEAVASDDPVVEAVEAKTQVKAKRGPKIKDMA